MIIKCPYCGEYVEPVLERSYGDHIVVICPVCRSELSSKDSKDLKGGDYDEQQDRQT